MMFSDGSEHQKFDPQTEAPEDSQSSTRSLPRARRQPRDPRTETRSFESYQESTRSASDPPRGAEANVDPNSTSDTDLGIHRQDTTSPQGPQLSAEVRQPTNKTIRLRRIPAEWDKAGILRRVTARLSLGDNPAVVVRSVSKSPYHHEEQVATIEISSDAFNRLGDNTNAEWPITVHGHELLLDAHFLGMTPLHAEDDSICDFDIIALSGLKGHAFDSFESKTNEPTHMWLRDSLPFDISNARIFIYGYNTQRSFRSISDLGQKLKNDVVHMRGRAGSSANRQLILIGHSLGGIMIKSAIVEMFNGTENEREIAKSICGVLFFGVPNQGMDTESLIPIVGDRTNWGLLHSLGSQSQFLHHLSHSFRNKLNSPRSMVFSFYEKIVSPAMMIEGRRAISASNGHYWDHGGPTYPVNRTHSELVKFDGTNDAVYGKLLDCLEDVLAKAKQKSGPYEGSISYPGLRGHGGRSIAALKTPSEAPTASTGYFNQGKAPQSPKSTFSGHVQTSTLITESKMHSERSSPKPNKHALAGNIASDSESPEPNDNDASQISDDPNERDGDQSVDSSLFTSDQWRDVEIWFTSILFKALHHEVIGLHGHSTHFQSLLQAAIRQWSAQIRKSIKDGPKRRVAGTIGQRAAQVAERLERLIGFHEEDGGTLAKSPETIEDKAKRFLKDSEAVSGPHEDVADAEWANRLYGQSDLESPEESGRVDLDTFSAYLARAPAFHNLVHRVELLIKHHRTDMPAVIRQQLLKASNLEHDSVKDEDAKLRAQFRAAWDFLEFMKESCGLIEDELTITGNGRVAQMETVSGYVKQTWPSYSRSLLEPLQEAYWQYLRSGQSWALDPIEEYSEAVTSISFRYSHVFVTVAGGQTFLSAIGQQLAWLGAACRIHLPQLSPGLIYYDAICQDGSKPEETTSSIEYSTSQLSESEEPEPWALLLGSRSIAAGFPVAHRERDTAGLQIPQKFKSRFEDELIEDTIPENGRIIDTDVTLLKTWLSSFAKRVTPKALDAALRSGDRKKLERCISDHFEDVSCGTYAWLLDLKALEHDPTATVDQVIESFQDAPWIVSECFRPPTMSTITPKTHVPACVHMGGEKDIDKDKLTEWTGIVAMQKKKREDTVRLIQELCGLAGVVPNIKERENLSRMVRFSKANTMATVTYGCATSQSTSGTALCIKQTVSALEAFCCAAGEAQGAGLCCDTFTFIRAVEGEKIAELMNVDLMSAKGLLDIIRPFKDSPDPFSLEFSTSWSAVADQALRILNKISTFPRPDLVSRIGLVHQAMQLCSLAVQFFCISFLAYRQAHIGPILPFFLDSPLEKILLLGKTNIDSDNETVEKYPYLIAELSDLSCMGSMTKEPVIVFKYGGSDMQVCSLKQVSQVLDVLASPEDIADTWGPARLLSTGGSSTTIRGMIVGDGIILPVPGEGRKFHWWKSDAVPVDQISWDFGTREKILIGTTVVDTGFRHLDTDKLRLASTGRMIPLETLESFYQQTGRSFAFSGQIPKTGSVTMTRTDTKVQACTLKDTIAQVSSVTDFIINLRLKCGLQVSFCTGVAKRVSLKELMADIVPELLSTDTRESRFGDIASKFRDRSPTAFQDWILSFDDQDRSRLLGHLRGALGKLKCTGFEGRTREKHLVICWLCPGFEHRCFRIPAKRASCWVSILADSPDCATFAYITSKCRTTTLTACDEKPALWSEGIKLLETQVTRESQDPQSDFTLEHRSPYFIGSDEPLQVMAHKHELDNKFDLTVAWNLWSKSYGKLRRAIRIGDSKRIIEALSGDYDEKHTRSVVLYALAEHPNESFTF